MFGNLFSNKKQTPLEEIERMANQEMILGLYRLSVARSKEQQKSFFEASRKLKNRSKHHVKVMGQLNRFQKIILKATGLSTWLFEGYPKDLYDLGEHFRYCGDMQGGMLEAWHGQHLEWAAKILENRGTAAKEKYGEQVTQDHFQAADSIRKMRSLVEPEIAKNADSE